MEKKNMGAFVIVFLWIVLGAFNVGAAAPDLRELSIAVNVGSLLFLFVLGYLLAPRGK